MGYCKRKDFVFEAVEDYKEKSKNKSYSSTTLKECVDAYLVQVNYLVCYKTLENSVICRITGCTILRCIRC